MKLVSSSLSGDGVENSRGEKKKTKKEAKFDKNEGKKRRREKTTKALIDETNTKGRSVSLVHSATHAVLP